MAATRDLYMATSVGVVVSRKRIQRPMCQCVLRVKSIDPILNHRVSDRVGGPSHAGSLFRASSYRSGERVPPSGNPVSHWIATCDALAVGTGGNVCRGPWILLAELLKRRLERVRLPVQGGR